MVQDVDLSAMLINLHAACVGYPQDAKRNMGVLANGGDHFFATLNNGMLTFESAGEVFSIGTFSQQYYWLATAPDNPTFMFHVTNRADGHITGDIYEVNLGELQDCIRKNSITFTHINATLKDGTSKQITNHEWNGMEQIDRDQVQSWTTHYDPTNQTTLYALIEAMPSVHEFGGRPISADDLIQQLGVSHMERADNPQPEMLRISLECAREILAKGATDVYRLTSEGAEKLNPIEAAKIGQLSGVAREFAINKHDIAALGKWAESSAKNMLRHVQAESNIAPKNRHGEI